MPLAAIGELSSLSARSGRIATSELHDSMSPRKRKGCLRPARITCQSQMASLRLTGATAAPRSVRKGFSKHTVWNGSKEIRR